MSKLLLIQVAGYMLQSNDFQIALSYIIRKSLFKKNEDGKFLDNLAVYLNKLVEKEPATNKAKDKYTLDNSRIPIRNMTENRLKESDIYQFCVVGNLYERLNILENIDENDRKVLGLLKLTASEEFGLKRVCRPVEAWAGLKK